MNLKRLLNTPLGVIFISVLLGFGLACLFHRACTDKSCIQFEGPVITDIHDKIYKHDEKCFEYVANSTKCNPNKKIIDVSSPLPVDS